MKRLISATVFVLCAAGIAASQELQVSRITNPRVAYVSRAELERPPVPALGFRGEIGPVSEAVKLEILEKIIYPLLNKTAEPIASIAVTIRSGGQEILVDVMWSNGDPFGFLIRRNKQGQIDDDTVSQLLLEGECDDGVEPQR